MTRASLIVYGNCQAGVFADSFRSFSSGATREWDTYYVMNFIHPSQPQRRIADEDLARCTLVIEQLDTAHPLPAWLRERLPYSARIIRFAPLDFNLYWPFHFLDPRNVSEPPDYPFGRFPYGDRIVVELLREGLEGEALWRAYQERSVARLPDLDRLRDVESRRLIAREATADVAVADLVLSNYREIPLFWTRDHPTGWLLGRMLSRLLCAAREPLGLTGDFESQAIKLMTSLEPFAHQHQPIHPEVARRLGLTWWTQEHVYRYFDGSELTFEEYMRRYINFS